MIFFYIIFNPKNLIISNKFNIFILNKKMNSLSTSIVNANDPETQSEISTLLERKLFTPEKDLDLENSNTPIKKEKALTMIKMPINYN